MQLLDQPGVSREVSPWDVSQFTFRARLATARRYSRCCLWCFKHGRRRGSTKLHGGYSSGVRLEGRHSTISSEETDDTANDTIDNNDGGDCGDGVALTELGLSVS